MSRLEAKAVPSGKYVRRMLKLNSEKGDGPDNLMDCMFLTKNLMTFAEPATGHYNTTRKVGTQKREKEKQQEQHQQQQQ